MMICAGLAVDAAAAPDWLPEGAELPAAYVVASGEKLIDSRAPAVRRQPASLAKLAGALVVLEAAGMDPSIMKAAVTVSAGAAATGGTRLGLRPMDRATARDLLAAMLVGSANDACMALAEHLGGAARFVERMNALAARLGATDTRFIDPCGFDRPGQHTTARDMLKIARAALAAPAIVGIAGQADVRVVTLNDRRALSAWNTNALVGRYDGAFGLKTGYTRQAGQCLVATARRGNLVVIVVVLGGKDRWPVTAALFDEAFSRLTGYPSVRSRSTIGEPDY